MYIKTITYYDKGERVSSKQTKLEHVSFYPDELEKGYKLTGVDYYNDDYGNCVYMIFTKSNTLWARVTIEKE